MSLIRTAIIAAALAFALICASTEARASDFSPLGGIVMTVPAVYDAQAGDYAAGLDVNLVLAFLNAGINYRHWDGDGPASRGWDGGAIGRDETTFYFGLGLLNILQLQAGFSDSGASMRVRSDLVLLAGSFPFFPSLYDDCPDTVDLRQCQRAGITRGGLVLTPSVEFTPFESNHKTLYSLGIGVLF